MNPNFPGVGTNARQMSLLVGLPLARKYGFHSLALDCPGYGVTQVAPKSKVTYSDWVDLVDAFVDAQTRRQLNEGRGTRPIVLFGLSAGGMLAYQVAARNANVKGVIGMTFLDQRVQEVRGGPPSSHSRARSLISKSTRDTLLDRHVTHHRPVSCAFPIPLY